jgi:hypothetical protein
MIRTTVRVVGGLAVVVALAGAAGMVGVSLSAQAPAAPAPQELEPENLDIAGYWVSIVNESWRWRMVTPPAGDFASLPLNDEGERVGNEWTRDQDGSCMAYGMGGVMRMPTRLHITWAEDDVLQIETDAGMQTRRLYFNPAEAPAQPSLQGRSVAEWQNTGGGGGGRRGGGPPPPPTAPEFGTLVVRTDNLTGGWIRRNGAPYSDQTTVVEYFDNFASPFEDESEWLVVTQLLTDPMYINGVYNTSSHFRREAGPDGPPPANWDPTPCRE